jgi:hypothetical protein
MFAMTLYLTNLVFHYLCRLFLWLSSGYLCSPIYSLWSALCGGDAVNHRPVGNPKRKV